MFYLLLQVHIKKQGVLCKNEIFKSRQKKKKKKKRQMIKNVDDSNTVEKYHNHIDSYGDIPSDHDKLKQLIILHGLIS